jgi:hypothetical protein
MSEPTSEGTGYGTGARFYIVGFDEWLKELGVTPGNVKLAEKTFLTVAAATVMNWAKENAIAEGSVAAKAKSDLRTGGPGVVRYGGKPYDMGAEFGSYQYHQFKIWRGNDDDAGYFLWPAIRQFRDKEMMNTWLHETWTALSEAFTGP